MLLLSVFRTMQALAVLGLLEALVFFASGYDLSFILRPVAQLLWAAVVPQLAVLAAWNVADWARYAHDGYVERQYQRDALAIERYMEAERASAAFTARVSPGLKAMQRAMLAGTYSVNGVPWTADKAHLSGPGFVSSANEKRYLQPPPDVHVPWDGNWDGTHAPGDLVAGSVRIACGSCGQVLAAGQYSPRARYICAECAGPQDLRLTHSTP